MPTTFTPNLNLAKPGRGDLNWDALVNGNFDIIDNIQAAAGTVAFGSVSAGTSAAALVVGTGGSLSFSGSGVVNANQLRGVPLFNQAPLPGQILIFDEATGNYVPGDPIVSGPDAPGTAPTRPPVQIGGFDGTNVQRIATDTGGNLNVNVRGTVPVSVSNFPSSQAVTGPLTDSQLRATAVPVSVSNLPATQAISAASLPLPTGASTSAKQPALGTAGTASADVITVQGIASMTALKVDGSAVTQPVSGTIAISNFPATQPISGSVSVSNFPATQAVSAASLPLPSGASTSAKQPALGTAGSASADVITVQGIASMTALKVDGSAVTQPISGTVTTTPPTHASTNVDQVNGTTIDTNSGVKSAGTIRMVLATDQPALTNALKVDGSAVTQPVSAASLPLPSGAATSAKQPALGTAGTASADVITVQGVASMTALKVDGSAVTQPVSGTVTANAGSGTFGVNLAQVGGSTVATAATGVAKVGNCDGSGNALTSTGSALDVNLKTSSITLGTKAVPQTSGGFGLPFSASVNATKQQVKGTAGQLYGYHILNTTSAIAYMQVFDKASASVTVGTTVADYIIPLPASGGATIEISTGIAHATGITIACTTTRTGSTNAACDVVIFYA